jgi:AmpD protein
MTLSNRPSLHIGPDGWATNVECIPSPNCDPRPPEISIDLIVIHAISLPPGVFGGSGVEELFTNRLDASAHPYYSGIAGRKVSSHFFIRRDGRLVQFVSCEQRAWHAGISCWMGKERCNDFSLGIELEGDDTNEFADEQYRSLVALIDALRQRYPIKAIAGHADIAPGRKTDPGPHFDWPRLREIN